MSLLIDLAPVTNCGHYRGRPRGGCFHYWDGERGGRGRSVVIAATAVSIKVPL